MDKAQKLTGALYRVTDLLSDKEPLKWILRERAVNIYNNLLIVNPVRSRQSLIADGFQRNPASNGVKNNDAILNIIFNDLSCLTKNLELVAIGTYISNLNFEILKKEYINLKSLINGENLSDISIGHLIGQSKSNGHSKVPRTTLGEHPYPRVVLGNLGNLDRKQKIVEFLTNNGPKTISEIMPNFNGIGEKSLQRDLSDLVHSSKIKAEGEKRWRRYSLELSTT